jgi:hypothetical protein
MWSSPGFNKTSAYGCAGTDQFGPVKPMIRSLVEVLRGLDDLRWPEPERVWCSRLDARELMPRRTTPRRTTVVYLDPNYVRSTGYPNGGLSRDWVVTLAKNWYDQKDATVMVSEAEPIPELLEAGWEARCLREPPSDDKPFQAKGAEWVTISPLRSSPDPHP